MCIRDRSRTFLILIKDGVKDLKEARILLEVILSDIQADLNNSKKAEEAVHS